MSAPAGWEVRESRKHQGHSFYWHAPTRTALWTVPTEEQIAAAAAAAAAAESPAPAAAVVGVGVPAGGRRTPQAVVSKVAQLEQMLDSGSDEDEDEQEARARQALLTASSTSIGTQGVGSRAAAPGPSPAPKKTPSPSPRPHRRRSGGGGGSSSRKSQQEEEQANKEEQPRPPQGWVMRASKQPPNVGRLFYWHAPTRKALWAVPSEEQIRVAAAADAAAAGSAGTADSGGGGGGGGGVVMTSPTPSKATPSKPSAIAGQQQQQQRKEVEAVASLQAQLRSALAAERYEDCAVLRDRIQRLLQREGGGGGGAAGKGVKAGGGSGGGRGGRRSSQSEAAAAPSSSPARSRARSPAPGVRPPRGGGRSSSSSSSSFPSQGPYSGRRRQQGGSPRTPAGPAGHTSAAGSSSSPAAAVAVAADPHQRIESALRRCCAALRHEAEANTKEGRHHRRRSRRGSSSSTTSPKQGAAVEQALLTRWVKPGTQRLDFGGFSHAVRQGGGVRAEELSGAELQLLFRALLLQCSGHSAGRLVAQLPSGSITHDEAYLTAAELGDFVWGRTPTTQSRALVGAMGRLQGGLGRRQGQGGGGGGGGRSRSPARRAAAARLSALADESLSKHLLRLRSPPRTGGQAAAPFGSGAGWHGRQRQRQPWQQQGDGTRPRAHPESWSQPLQPGHSPTSRALARRARRGVDAIAPSPSNTSLLATSSRGVRALVSPPRRAGRGHSRHGTSEGLGLLHGWGNSDEDDDDEEAEEEMAPGGPSGMAGAGSSRRLRALLSPPRSSPSARPGGRGGLRRDARGRLQSPPPRQEMLVAVSPWEGDGVRARRKSEIIEKTKQRWEDRKAAEISRREAAAAEVEQTLAHHRAKVLGSHPNYKLHGEVLESHVRRLAVPHARVVDGVTERRQRQKAAQAQAEHGGGGWNATTRPSRCVDGAMPAPELSRRRTQLLQSPTRYRQSTAQRLHAQGVACRMGAATVVASCEVITDCEVELDEQSGGGDAAGGQVAAAGAGAGAGAGTAPLARARVRKATRVSKHAAGAPAAAPAEEPRRRRRNPLGAAPPPQWSDASQTARVLEILLPQCLQGLAMGGGGTSAEMMRRSTHMAELTAEQAIERLQALAGRGGAGAPGRPPRGQIALAQLCDALEHAEGLGLPPLPPPTRAAVAEISAEASGPRGGSIMVSIKEFVMGVWQERRCWALREKLVAALATTAAGPSSAARWSGGEAGWLGLLRTHCDATDTGRLDAAAFQRCVRGGGGGGAEGRKGAYYAGPALSSAAISDAELLQIFNHEAASRGRKQGGGGHGGTGGKPRQPLTMDIADAARLLEGKLPSGRPLAAAAAAAAAADQQVRREEAAAAADTAPQSQPAATAVEVDVAAAPRASSEPEQSAEPPEPSEPAHRAVHQSSSSELGPGLDEQEQEQEQEGEGASEAAAQLAAAAAVERAAQASQHTRQVRHMPPQRTITHTQRERGRQRGGGAARWTPRLLAWLHEL
jgi:hypothetical protein